MSGTWVYSGPGLPEGYEPPPLSLDVHDRAVRDKAGCVVRFTDEPEVYDRRPIERARAEACGQTAPMFGVTAEMAAANLKAALGGCPHGLAEEVRLCTGEVVAAVCPTCLDVLPAAWVGSDWRP